MHGATRGGGQPRWSEVRRLREIEDAAIRVLSHPYSKKAKDSLKKAIEAKENV